MAQCVSLMFLPHFDVICDLLLHRHNKEQKQHVVDGDVIYALTSNRSWVGTNQIACIIQLIYSWTGPSLSERFGDLIYEKWNLCSLLPFLFRWEYFLCRTERDFNHSPTCDEAFPCSGGWTRSWHCNIWRYSHCLCSGWWTFTSHQMQDTVFHTLSFTGWGVLRWPECSIRAHGELLKITETTLPFFSSHLREVIYKAATLLALFPYPLILSLLLLNRKLASHTIGEVFQFLRDRRFWE